jgi:CheY-like chemotaxis protein
MFKNKVLFIVDDDEDDINLFVEAVNEIDQSMGCFIGKNGEDALNRLDQLEMLPDVIFLDLNMPKMNGREFLARLKASDRFKDIPVVIYSTSSAEQDKIETKALGAADYLVKPDSFTDLCIQLARLIRTQGNK